MYSVFMDASFYGLNYACVNWLPSLWLYNWGTWTCEILFRLFRQLLGNLSRSWRHAKQIWRFIFKENVNNLCVSP